MALVYMVKMGQKTWEGLVCTEIHYAVQAGLKLGATSLPQPPQCRDYRHEPLCPVSGLNFHSFVATAMSL